MPAPVASRMAIQGWPDGVTPIRVAKPCRYCGKKAYLKDADGPLHTCCQSYADIIDLEAGNDCPSCRASRMSRAKQFEKTILDTRAIASGKRRSSLSAYRQAQRDLKDEEAIREASQRWG